MRIHSHQSKLASEMIALFTVLNKCVKLTEISLSVVMCFISSTGHSSIKKKKTRTSMPQYKEDKRPFVIRGKRTKIYGNFGISLIDIQILLIRKLLNLNDFCSHLVQWGKKVFSQPPIVQVLPLKKMREACNFHHRYTSTMRDKIRKTIQKITL